jgi:hypothetical protein
MLGAKVNNCDQLRKQKQIKQALRREAKYNAFHNAPSCHMYVVAGAEVRRTFDSNEN